MTGQDKTRQDKTRDSKVTLGLPSIHLAGWIEGRSKQLPLDLTGLDGTRLDGTRRDKGFKGDFRVAFYSSSRVDRREV